MYNLANALVIAKDTLTLIVNYTSVSPWEAEMVHYISLIALELIKSTISHERAFSSKYLSSSVISV